VSVTLVYIHRQTLEQFKSLTVKTASISPCGLSNILKKHASHTRLLVQILTLRYRRSLKTTPSKPQSDLTFQASPRVPVSAVIVCGATTGATALFPIDTSGPFLSNPTLQIWISWYSTATVGARPWNGPEPLASLRQSEPGLQGATTGFSGEVGLR
jgi:hypothetical protein